MTTRFPSEAARNQDDPTPSDPIRAARGMFREGGPSTEDLLEERRQDLQSELKQRRRPYKVRSRILRGLLLATTVAVLLLAGAELALHVALRLRDGAWPRTKAAVFYDQIEVLRRIYRRHAYLNTGPREGGRAEVFGKRATLNRLGYRSPERPRAKPAGVVRVLVSGGSTTFDVLADDDASTWPNLLGARLRAGGRAIEVWNAGFPGWTSQENVISFA